MVSFQVAFRSASNQESKILAVVATAGQGEMPKSAVKFWQDRVVAGLGGGRYTEKMRASREQELRNGCFWVTGITT